MDNVQTQCRHDEDAVPRWMARRSTGWQETHYALQGKNEKDSSEGWDSHVTCWTKMEDGHEKTEDQDNKTEDETHCNENTCERTLDVSVQERERIPCQVGKHDKSDISKCCVECLLKHEGVV